MVELRHFLDLHDLPAVTLRRIVEEAKRLKKLRHDDKAPKPLSGRKLAMIFEKNSTRTRVSFEVGMWELGGYALYLNGNDLQLGRGESIRDTAKVLSRYVDAILLRCHRHEDLLELAGNANVPVINALSNRSHPCQIMADIMTVEEKLGTIEGKTIAWVGDGNNVAHSWIGAAAKFGFRLRLACPESLQPLALYLDEAKSNGADVAMFNDPASAVAGADVVVTDTWVSMGEQNSEQRVEALKAYQVNDALMANAAAHAIFLHCLPAHRGEEVTAEIMDSARSAVWDEAENRLHVQKAILLWCLHALA